MDFARRRQSVQLEELPRRIRAVSTVRHLEAAAGPAVGGSAGRARNQRRRLCRGPLCRTCVMAGGMVQSLLNMPLRKSSDSRPQISQVTPPAAIAGGELQIHGKGFVKSDR